MRSPWFQMILHRVRGRLVVCERGQTLPLVCAFTFVLLTVSAFSIDVGSWYLSRSHTQADADAAALAAAADVPSGWAAESASGQANFAVNKISGETVALSPATSSTYGVSNDSVTATVSRQAPSYFANVLGITSVGVSATATATIMSAGSVFGHVSPYAVLRSNYANGTGTTLFTANDSNNYGTIDLPTPDNTTGGSCSGNTILGTSGNVSGALNGSVISGELDLGGCLSPKPGAAQPSANVVNSMPGSMTQDLQLLSNGTYQVIPQSWDDSNGLPPRLVFVPIVDSIDPQGNAPMYITGFAWFYMTGTSGNGNGLKIVGQYVSSNFDCNPTKANCKTSKYIPGAGGVVNEVALTN